MPDDGRTSGSDNPEAPDCVAENVAVERDICETSEESTFAEDALSTSVSEGKKDGVNPLPVVTLEERVVPSQTEGDRLALAVVMVAVLEIPDTDASVSIYVGDGVSVDEGRKRLTDTVVRTSTDETMDVLEMLENRGSCAVVSTLR